MSKLLLRGCGYHHAHPPECVQGARQVTETRLEPVWLNAARVRLLHTEALELFGDTPGIRDLGLFESALSRPVNKRLHERTDSLFKLAASYAFGIARNHAFVDGNNSCDRSALRSNRRRALANPLRLFEILRR